MLAKDPAQRFQKPAEVAQALLPFTKPGAKPAAAAPAAAPAAESPSSTLAFDTEPALPRRRPAARPAKNRGPLIAGLAAAAIVGVSLLAWAVLRVQTPNGTLVIKTNDPDVQVLVKQDGKQVQIVDTKSGQEVELQAGTYELELKGGKPGLKLSTDRFTLSRGDQKIVEVTLERTVTQGPPPATSRTPPPVPATGKAPPATKPETVPPVKPPEPPIEAPEPRPFTKLPGKDYYTNTIGMHFVKVPKGTFWMGGGGGNPGTQQVTIDKEFFLGVFEVTQEQWQAVMGRNPSHFSRTGGGKDKVKNIPDAELVQFPVESVSWEDCQEFISRLNAKENMGGAWLYRLPTDAEWEYACRGAATSKEECGFDFYLEEPTNSLSSAKANITDSKTGRAVKVGSYPANGAGIYDMHGNVREWCNDVLEGQSTRVNRGGSWRNAADVCRASYPVNNGATHRHETLGLRLARVPTGLPPSPLGKPPEARPFTKLPDKDYSTNSIGMHFVKVPKGTFWMGGGGGKPGTKQVAIDQDFYFGVFEVTQEQWQAVMGNNPSHFSRTGPGQDQIKDIPDNQLAHFPVEMVSWDDCQEFIKRLNEREKAGWLYRIPTEAEWEFACRGAYSSKNDCAFDFYLDQPTNELSSLHANFDGSMSGNAPKGPNLERTAAVGSYQPNRLGLYDMHGNVREWSLKALPPQAPTPVACGGSWSNSGSSCRAAERINREPERHYNTQGFRLIRVPNGMPSVAQTSGLIRQLEGAQARVVGLAFSLDGRNVVACTNGDAGNAAQNAVRLWDTETGQLLSTWEEPKAALLGVAFSADRRHVLASGKGEIVRVYDAEKRTYVGPFSNASLKSPCAQFTPDGKKVLLLGGGYVQVYDFTTKKQERRFEGMVQGVDLMAVSADGKVVITNGTAASSGWYIHGWDFESGKKQFRPGPFAQKINQIAIAPDGSRVLSCGADNLVRLWDLATGKELQRITAPAEPLSIAFSPDCRVGPDDAMILISEEDLLPATRQGDQPERMGQTIIPKGAHLPAKGTNHESVRCRCQWRHRAGQPGAAARRNAGRGRGPGVAQGGLAAG